MSDKITRRIDDLETEVAFLRKVIMDMQAYVCRPLSLRTLDWDDKETKKVVLDRILKYIKELDY